MLKTTLKSISALAVLLLSLLPAAARTVATGPVVVYVDNAGNDANDGLSLATAKQHYCSGLRALYYQWDFGGHQPYLFVRSGQQFNELCSPGGTLVGAVSVIIAPYDPEHPSSPGNIVPSANFVRTCSPTSPVGPCGSQSIAAIQWCDAFGDLAIHIYYNVTWADCNHYNIPGGGTLLLHNVATADFFGTGTIFRGSGDNDAAIVCDGPCIFTVSNGATFEGQFNKGFLCNRACNATVSGEISLSAATLAGIYGMYSNSNLALSATYSRDLLSIVGPSVASGHSNISLNSTDILGGVASESGGNVCPAYC